MNHTSSLVAILRGGSSWRIAQALLRFAAIGILATAAMTQAQVLSSNALVSALRKGGYVIVVRHANSPSILPSKETAAAGNVTLERQVDATGRQDATALGQGLKTLQIPVGEVFASPAFRAIETARLAQLMNPKLQEELGEGGQGGMQAISDAQADWLKERVKHLPKENNTILITHNPNLTKAFPSWGGTVLPGEAVVVDLDARGATRVVGRIKPEEWSRLR